MTVSIEQNQLRAAMIVELTGMKLCVGNIVLYTDEHKTESVEVEILDDEYKPLPIKVVRYVDNPNWFVSGNNYKSALDTYELRRMIGQYGVGEHALLTDWYKVWVVSSGYTPVINRPHSAFSYYSNKAEAFQRAMHERTTVFGILVCDKPNYLADAQAERLEHPTEYEFDKGRSTDSFRIFAEPINFGH